MLILTRKKGERIVIAGDVVVEVVEVMGKIVRIGIQAPRSVPIVREEVLTRRQRCATVDDQTQGS